MPACHGKAGTILEAPTCCCQVAATLPLPALWLLQRPCWCVHASDTTTCAIQWLAIHRLKHCLCVIMWMWYIFCWNITGSWLVVVDIFMSITCLEVNIWYIVIISCGLLFHSTRFACLMVIYCSVIITLSICPKSYNRHHIAHCHTWGMGCLFLVQSLFYFQPLLCYMQYHYIWLCYNVNQLYIVWNIILCILCRR